MTLAYQDEQGGSSMLDDVGDECAADLWRMLFTDESIVSMSGVRDFLPTITFDSLIKARYCRNLST